MTGDRIMMLAGSRDAGRVERLSRREREILALMAQGLSNRAISDRLAVTGKTLESHVGRIFTKLDLPPTDAQHRRVVAVLQFLATTAELSEPIGA